MFNSKKGPKKSFDDLALLNKTTGLVNVRWAPISGGLYSKHLDKWYRHFPRTSIYVVSGEGLISDPAKEMSKVQVCEDEKFYSEKIHRLECGRHRAPLRSFLYIYLYIIIYLKNICLNKFSSLVSNNKSNILH